MKKYLKALIIFVLLLGVGGGWYLLWQKVQRSVEDAEFEAQISYFDAGGAHYQRLDAEGLAAYLPDAGEITAKNCGLPLGTQALSVSAGTLTANAYVLADYAYTGVNVPVRVLEIAGRYYAYELVGFSALDGMPTIGAVCEAYGIGSAADIAEITETVADTKEVREITDAGAIQAYYEKIAALSEPLTNAQTAQIYYDVYTAEYGETDKLEIADDTVNALDDETYEKAMSLWGEGMYTADISLKNGLKLRGCICAPKTGIFSVYANYRMAD